ncbi:hypothetical protein ACWEQD_15710 [Rhodococcus pyridinivorans]
MANVTIYPEHRDILDALISTAKTSSVAAATRTGPFTAQRDAYVFAASLALALGSPQEEDHMPRSRKDITTIRDSVFLGADGADALTFTVSLIEAYADESINDGLARQLNSLTEEMLQDRFTLLDRYAYAGFEWLIRNQRDESSVRDLILTTLNEVSCVESAPAEVADVHDPLLEMLI